MGRKQSELEIGIRAAQLLMDARKQKELKRDITAAFPLVPEPVVDGVISVTADAFKTIAPEELQLALRPGWIAKNRSRLRQPIVFAVMDNDVMRDVPVLSGDAKKSLVEKLVDLGLDRIVEEADGLLTAPEIRLAALEAQVREVKMQMGRRRLLWYRIRKNPRRSGTAILSLAAAFYISGDTALTAAAISFGSKASAIFFTLVDLFREKMLWVVSMLQRAASWLMSYAHSKL